MTSHRIKTILICTSLFFGTLLLFSRALQNEFLDLDDPDYVTHNSHVQAGLSWTTLRWALTSGDASNWHPLTWLSHALDCQFFGVNPVGHHATSIVFHAINAVLVFLVLRCLTSSSPSDSTWLCAFSAALFAWHPLRVESVAWISERKDVLSVCFGLLTLWSYAVFASRRRTAGPSAKRFYALALVTFAAGLMCKPMLVTLPFLLLLLDYWPLGRFMIGDLRYTIWRLVAEKIPFLLLTAASCVITYLVQSNGGAVVDNVPLPARLANAVVSLVRYLGKYFWPFDLAIGYPTPERWPLSTVLGAALLVLAISALAVRQRRRRPWLLVGWLWFLGTLVPVIGLVQVGLQSMADRYTYLPMLGIQIALLGSLRELYRRGANGNRSEEWGACSPTSFRWFAPAAAILLLAALAARTWDQLAVWRTPLTLHWHALAVTESNYLAESYLGTTLFNRERFTEAAEHYRRAIELKANFRNAHYRLGRTLEQLNQPAEAVAAYQRAIAINPTFSAARYSLGLLHLSQGQPTNAIVQFEAALQSLRATDTESLGLKTDLHVALGTALSRSGQPQDAVTQFENALALDERNAASQFNCANALSDLERYEEARVRYERALQLDPDFVAAQNNYANCLRALQRPADACAAYQHALTLRPDDADAHYGFGAALEDLGRTEDALASYREAARLKPDFAEAQYNVGVLLLHQNQAAAALPHLEHALRLKPQFPGLAEALGRLRQNAGAANQP